MGTHSAFTQDLLSLLAATAPAVATSIPLLQDKFCVSELLGLQSIFLGYDFSVFFLNTAEFRRPSMSPFY